MSRSGLPARTWTSCSLNSDSTQQPHPQARPIVLSLPADHYSVRYPPHTPPPPPVRPGPCTPAPPAGRDLPHQRPQQVSAAQTQTLPAPGHSGLPAKPIWPLGALVTATVKGRAAQEVLGGAEDRRTPSGPAQVHGRLHPPGALARAQPRTSRPPGPRTSLLGQPQPCRPALVSPHLLTSQRAHPPPLGRSH